MAGRIDRDSRREDVKSRRKTLRQSALEAKRGSGVTAKESPAKAGRVTRGVLRTQTSKAAAARRVEEKKMRKAITDREVQKAKPPFNPYVRVKHTGLSPFRSYQEARKRSKIAPWRAPAAAPAPSTSGAGTRPANTNRAPAHGITAISKPAVQPAVPEMKMAAGVIQFPILPHMHHAQITFRAPAKVQPIPLSTGTKKSILPAKKEAHKENVKPAPKLRPVRGVSVKAQSTQAPKVNSQTKIPLAAAAATVSSQTKSRRTAQPKVNEVAHGEKPVRKTTAAPATKAAQSAKNVRPTRAKSAAPSKPAGAKAPVAEVAKRLPGRRLAQPAKNARLALAETVAKKANQDEQGPALAQRIQPPARVLRSSSRLQHRDKENLIPANQPVLELPLVQRRRTKKPTTVIPQDEPESEDPLPAAPEVAQSEASLRPASQPNATLEPAGVPEIASTSASSGPSDERVRGLEERSSKLIVETDRLRSLADEWIALKSCEEHLTQNAIDEIDAVTGQTYLLITKKFIQYKGLIEGAYKNPKTTLDDLDGFWEMVYIQVEQLENQYRELEDMKKRNWITHSPAPVKKPTKTSAKPPKRPPPKANFRKFLAEKKKKVAASPEPAVIEPSQAGPKSHLLSPGLNMSVDEVIPTPVRSAQSSLRNTNTPARRSLRLPESPVPPSRASSDASMRRQPRTPRRGTVLIPDSPARKSARVARSSVRKSSRFADSPLHRSLHTSDSPFRGSIRGVDSPLRDSPRAIENARRASRSIRLSTTMMRVSQVIASEMESTMIDPLAT